ncbi:MAG TPA: acyl-CoA dehydrogenase family protein [Anaerolineales bacterium]|nr:acyl-CoA dehydrogenase family protein [Anaerolineales bacterium]
MFDFEPSDEQQMLIDWVKRFSVNDLRPVAHDAEETGLLPNTVLVKGWEMGILQASIPEQYTGFGDRSAITNALALEELAYGDMAGAIALMTPGLFAFPILLVGSEAQKETYLPPLLDGDWPPFTAALLEPTFDFDPLDLKTTAVQEGDGYVLTGIKTMVPFAKESEKFIVYAKLEGKTQGFIVSTQADGVTVGERNKLLGINGLPAYKVTLEGVRVPFADRLGGVDENGVPQGHAFAPILDSSRVALASLALGLSRAAFDYARDYAKDREVFGVKVAQKQAIAFMIAEMATEIEATRLLVWKAAWMLDQGHLEASKYAYLAITGATDMAMMVTDRAVQILGGHGYIREHPVEFWMRNGRGIATLTGLAMI